MEEDGFVCKENQLRKRIAKTLASSALEKTVIMEIPIQFHSNRILICLVSLFILVSTLFIPFCHLEAKGIHITTKASAFVIDANTGQILHNYLGTELRYPASLTKMMTLYLAFEAIRSKKLSLNTQLLVTEKAASVAPSKLGLSAGSQISLENAIKALIVKSANDMAVAIAERISVSEFAFAQLMTLKAKKIGMKQTVFRNASGLPNKTQVTTAADMVTLGLRLQQDYPEFYKLFSLRSFSYNGKTYHTHNNLLSSFDGVDGIKTGYTRISGFNIVSSYNLMGKIIIGAVFGGVSSSARDAHMRMLLALAIEKAKDSHPPIKGLVSTSDPNVLQDKKNKLEIKQNANEDSYPQSIEKIIEGSNENKKPPERNSSLNRQTKNSWKVNSDTQRPIQIGTLQNTKIHSVQIGVFKNINNAEQALSAARIKLSSLLKNHPSEIIPLNKSSNSLFIARFSNFQNDKATKTCLELRRINMECLIVQNQ